MIVNYKDRWCYVSPPKTASTSLHEFLIQPPFNGGSYGVTHTPYSIAAHHLIQPPPEFNPATWTIFYSVRHPYTRCLSLYSHFISERDQANLSFDNWLDLVPSNRLTGFFFRSCTHWLNSIHTLPNAIPIRTEHILADLSTAFDRLNLPHITSSTWPLLPKRNKTKHPSLPTIPQCDRINSLYRDDINNWYMTDIRHDYPHRSNIHPPTQFID